MEKTLNQKIHNYTYTHTRMCVLSKGGCHKNSKLLTAVLETFLITLCFSDMKTVVKFSSKSLYGEHF